METIQQKNILGICQISQKVEFTGIFTIFAITKSKLFSKL